MHVYDICSHLNDYSENQISVEFANPISVGDYITDGIGDDEFEVFQVVHSTCGGGSCVHVRCVKTTPTAVGTEI